MCGEQNIVRMTAGALLCLYVQPGYNLRFPKESSENGDCNHPHWLTTSDSTCGCKRSSDNVTKTQGRSSQKTNKKYTLGVFAMCASIPEARTPATFKSMPLWTQVCQVRDSHHHGTPTAGDATTPRVRTPLARLPGARRKGMREASGEEQNKHVLEHTSEENEPSDQTQLTMSPSRCVKTEVVRQASGNRRMVNNDASHCWELRLSQELLTT